MDRETYELSLHYSIMWLCHLGSVVCNKVIAAFCLYDLNIIILAMICQAFYWSELCCVQIPCSVKLCLLLAADVSSVCAPAGTSVKLISSSCFSFEYPQKILTRSCSVKLCLFDIRRRILVCAPAGSSANLTSSSCYSFVYPQKVLA